MEVNCITKLTTYCVRVLLIWPMCGPSFVARLLKYRPYLKTFWFSGVQSPGLVLLNQEIYTFDTFTDRHINITLNLRVKGGEQTEHGSVQMEN